MKILFAVRHPLYLRNYELVLRELARRGHRIHVAFSPIGKDVEDTLAARLADDHSEITFGDLPDRTGWWRPVTNATRTLVDYLRYLDPLYGRAPRLAARAARRVPPSLIKLFGTPVFNHPFMRERVSRFLPRLDEQIPADAALAYYVREHGPDLLLLTPLIDFTYLQYDALKAARELGIPTGLCVASWDNLTNKGIIQIKADRTFVWNEVQRREAESLHGVPPATIAVTGAQLFDEWFGMAPSWSREAFCARVGGLDPTRPVVLYLCSSKFICADEVDVVRKWLAALRSSDDAVLREANVVVRPHPAHVEQWQDVDLGAWGNALVWPRAGGVPIDEERKQGYFDSLHHSAVCVGINTSGFIEAAIVGRRTLTLRMEESAATQDGTVHFRHLVEGGLIIVAASWEEHLRQLSGALGAATGEAAQLADAVKAFVRPHGLDRPATPILVNEIETLGAATRAPAKAPWWGAAARAAYLPLAKFVIRPKYLAWEVSQKKRKGEPVAAALGASPLHMAARRQGTGATIATRLKTFVDEADRTLLAIAASRRPVLVGPWLSEVGYELLYWIPFVTWAVEHYGIARERLIVVSRGGARPWYDDLAHRYVELFDHFDADTFRRRNDARLTEVGIQKQKKKSGFDDEIVDLVKRRFQAERLDILHPALMYNGFLRSHWSGRSTMQHLFAHSSHRMMAPPVPGELEARLPENYFAVRFYFRESFADTPDNRALVERVVESLSRQGDIVLLNAPYRVDEHHDAAVGGRRVVMASDFMTPQNNLDVQTRIIARSRAFVGTYGGLSYIAPFYGRPSVSFHDTADDVLAAHVNTAATVFRSFKVPYLVLTPRELEMVDSLGGGAAALDGERRSVA